MLLFSTYLYFCRYFNIKAMGIQVALQNGILHDVLRIMKVAAYNISSIDKLCVLSFDEVKVQETMEYDEDNDVVIGPYRLMQVTNLFFCVYLIIVCIA